MPSDLDARMRWIYGGRDGVARRRAARALAEREIVRRRVGGDEARPRDPGQGLERDRRHRHVGRHRLATRRPDGGASERRPRERWTHGRPERGGLSVGWPVSWRGALGPVTAVGRRRGGGEGAPRS